MTLVESPSPRSNSLVTLYIESLLDKRDKENQNQRDYIGYWIDRATS